MNYLNQLNNMKINVEMKNESYDILIKENIICNLKDYLDCSLHYFIISDENVSAIYADTLLQQLPNAILHTVISGEGAKSFEVFEKCLTKLQENHFTRKDTIIALGGGVIGDLSGFVAATYLRGIDFIQIPTTTLSQIDSSIGGKVAINLNGVKNVVGAFKQPKMVLIDPNTLKTLDQRNFVNGLVEAIKVGVICNDQILELFEEDNLNDNLEKIIALSINVKKDVVQQDPYEKGIRAILNFGHTIGHGVESYYNLTDVYHGEAVAIGMVKMISNDEIKKRVIKIFNLLKINVDIEYDKDLVFQYIMNDKKMNKNKLTIITCSKINEYEIKEILIDDIKNYM